jgi:hypothetical protein
MMIDSAFIKRFTSADAIAELHIRDRSQEEGNRNCHENDVSHIRLSSGATHSPQHQFPPQRYLPP